MATKAKNNESVNVSRATLKAIQGLLFSKDGVDLSSIITDVVGNQDPDVVALNVGLVYKGLKPEINTDTVFRHSHNCYYYSYEFKSYSLILGNITYVRKYIKVAADGTKELISEDIVTVLFGELQGESLGSVMKEIAAYYNQQSK